MYEQVSELDYFRTLVADSERIPLTEAAAALALDEYPELDLQQVLSDVDRLTQRLSHRCRNASTESSRLTTTLNFFYKELRFSGNHNDYYHPDNSFIHRVIETRRGIPISLAVLLIDLARSVGLQAAGISFPGHFLVKVSMGDGLVVIDPFTGHSLSSADIQERLDPFRESMQRAGEAEIPTDLFLQVAPPNQILLRMLNNLYGIYRQQDDRAKVARILERIKILEQR